MSSRAKRRNNRLGINARRGGGNIPTVYVGYRVKINRRRKGPPIPRESIAELYGNDAPAGEMTDLRCDWLRWEKRKEKQQKTNAPARRQPQ